MTKEQLLYDLNNANLIRKFEPGSYPMDEDLAEWLVEYFNEEIDGFRNQLEGIIKDDLLKNTALPLDKFDEYFYPEKPPVKREVQEPL